MEKAYLLLKRRAEKNAEIPKGRFILDIMCFLELKNHLAFADPFLSFPLRWWICWWPCVGQLWSPLEKASSLSLIPLLWTLLIPKLWPLTLRYNCLGRKSGLRNRNSRK